MSTAELNQLGRALVANPADADVTTRWTRAVVEALPDDPPAVVDHLMSLVGRVPGSKIEAVVVHELALGRDRVARHLVSRLARAERTAPVVLLHHNVALHLGAVELADKIGGEVTERGFASEHVTTTMAARRALAGYRPEQAVAVLAEVAPDDVQHTTLLLLALRALGRHDRVLEVLETTEIPPVPIHTIYRYDALLAIGELDAARAIAESLGVDDVVPVTTFALRLHHSTRSDDARQRLIADARALETRDGPTAAVLHAYVEIGLLDDMERIAATVDRDALDPPSVVHLARMHYVRGRFDAAMALLDTLTGLDDRWDAEMLRLRIMTETGRSAEAIERQWPRTGTVHTQLDDALYHALLREHRLADAFRSASPWRQKQLKALFGDKAGDGEDLPHVRTRFVMTQSGPGDELIAASVYRELAAFSDELVVTCDPRLESVLTRSLPGITFLPVKRLRPRSDSFLGPDVPDRADNSQFEELTVAAFERADASDEVLLSRLLQHRALAKRRRPARGYLVPDPQLAAEWADRLPAGPRVGIVWRSELRSPMRDIHYLDVDDLAPLLKADATFVSLQYDATADEREALHRMTGGRVWFPDGVDLRNDFEAALALSTGLSAVVGVGTTGLELAAAGGVPTVLLATNHLIAWRATDRRGSDFWHESVRLAVCDDLWDREQLVRAGAAALTEILRGKPSRRGVRRRFAGRSGR